MMVSVHPLAADVAPIAGARVDPAAVRRLRGLLHTLLEGGTASVFLCLVAQAREHAGRPLRRGDAGALEAGLRQLAQSLDSPRDIDAAVEAMAGTLHALGLEAADGALLRRAAGAALRVATAGEAEFEECMLALRLLTARSRGAGRAAMHGRPASPPPQC